MKQGVATLQDDMRPLTQEVYPRNQETALPNELNFESVFIVNLQVLTLALACYRAAPQPAALDLSKQFFIM